ncbi:MAG TPA: hypothetical protein PKN56_12780 [Leptospiraceae bacterium]|nr:hypothetical protein [Leptospiraceae bacterium]HNM06761.1 hypothetical protein [Leptospiraceae bacterium]HNN04433.1 hypothetical protein [Leptospiraceae bacterium]
MTKGIFLSAVMALFLSVCNRIGVSQSCLSKCSSQNKACLAINYASNTSLTNSLSSSSSSSSSSATKTEVEPNDTFYNSNQNFNAFGEGSSTTKSTFNGTINSSNDIDILPTGTTDANFKGTIFTQNNNLTSVNCELFYGGSSTLDYSNTSVPDSGFKSAGKLNPSYTFPYVKDLHYAIYIICKGTANTSYSVTAEIYDPGVSPAVAVGATINSTSYANCVSSEKAYQKNCNSKGLF